MKRSRWVYIFLGLYRNVITKRNFVCSLDLILVFPLFDLSPYFQFCLVSLQNVPLIFCIVTQEKGLTLISSHIVLNRLLKCPSLLQNTIFHFTTQFMVHLKILELKLHITFFLRVYEFRKECLSGVICRINMIFWQWKVFMALHRLALVRDTFLELPLRIRAVVQRILDVELAVDSESASLQFLWFALLVRWWDW